MIAILLRFVAAIGLANTVSEMDVVGNEAKGFVGLCPHQSAYRLLVQIVEVTLRQQTMAKTVRTTCLVKMSVS